MGRSRHGPSCGGGADLPGQPAQAEAAQPQRHRARFRPAADDLGHDIGPGGHERAIGLVQPRPSADRRSRNLARARLEALVRRGRLRPGHVRARRAGMESSCLRRPQGGLEGDLSWPARPSGADRGRRLPRVADLLRDRPCVDAAEPHGAGKGADRDSDRHALERQLRDLRPGRGGLRGAAQHPVGPRRPARGVPLRPRGVPRQPGRVGAARQSRGLAR